MFHLNCGTAPQQWMLLQKSPSNSYLEHSILLHGLHESLQALSFFPGFCMLHLHATLDLLPLVKHSHGIQGWENIETTSFQVCKVYRKSKYQCVALLSFCWWILLHTQSQQGRYANVFVVIGRVDRNPAAATGEAWSSKHVRRFHLQILKVKGGRLEV